MIEKIDMSKINTTVCGVHNIELQDKTNQDICRLARKINEVIEDYNRRVGSDGI